MWFTVSINTQTTINPYLEHLSGDDNRLANDVALGDHHLLSEEDLAGGNFNTQITTGDHNTVGHSQDLVKVLDTLLVLNLDDDLNVGTVGTEDLADVQDILSTTDEGSKDHVYTVLDTELEILLVLLGESRKVDIGLGEVDTLAGAEGSVVESPNLDVRSVDRQNEQREDTYTCARNQNREARTCAIGQGLTVIDVDEFTGSGNLGKVRLDGSAGKLSASFQSLECDWNKGGEH